MLFQVGTSYTKLNARGPAGRMARLIKAHPRMGWDQFRGKPVSAAHPMFRRPNVLNIRQQHVQNSFLAMCEKHYGGPVKVEVRPIPPLFLAPMPPGEWRMAGAVESEGGEA